MATADPLRRRMSALDASFLYLEQPNALLHVGAIFTFAKPIELTRLVTYMAERLPLVPRYAQRAVTVPLNLGHPTWEHDPNFEIHDHVIRHHLRDGGDDQDLARLCAKVFAEALDRERPLWEMHIIDGYGDGCAILSKTHHAMIDGASGVQLANLLMDPSPRPRPPTPRSLPKAESVAHPMVRAADAVLDRVQTQVGFLSAAAAALTRPARALVQIREVVDAVSLMTRTLADPPPSTPFNGELDTKRTVAWTALSLSEVRAIKGRLGGTVNDVILSVICGGLRNYLIESRENVGNRILKAAVPVSLRAESEQAQLGNRVSTMIVPLPVGVANPVDRLRQISAATEQLKTSGQSRQLDRLIALVEVMPPFLQRPLASWQGLVTTPANTVCTNVPGPGETRYLLGEPVQRMIPLVPLGGSIGLGFAILSYANQLTIGINADATMVASAWNVDRCVRRAFDELWSASGLERRDAAVKVASALHRRARLRAPGHGGSE